MGQKPKKVDKIPKIHSNGFPIFCHSSVRYVLDIRNPERFRDSMACLSVRAFQSWQNWNLTFCKLKSLFSFFYKMAKKVGLWIRDGIWSLYLFKYIIRPFLKCKIGIFLFLISEKSVFFKTIISTHFWCLRMLLMLLRILNAGKRRDRISISKTRIVSRKYFY